MKINLGNKKIDIRVRKVRGLGMVRGLIFRNRNCENLLFDLGKESRWGIHSWFVSFDFLAVWLDNDFNVLEYRIVKPWSFHVKPKKKFRYLVELPVNKKNKKIIDNFYRRQKFTVGI